MNNSATPLNGIAVVFALACGCAVQAETKLEIALDKAEALVRDGNRDAVVRVMTNAVGCDAARSDSHIYSVSDVELLDAIRAAQIAINAKQEFLAKTLIRSMAHCYGPTGTGRLSKFFQGMLQVPGEESVSAYIALKKRCLMLEAGGSVEILKGNHVNAAPQGRYTPVSESGP